MITCERCGQPVTGRGQLKNHVGSLPCLLTASCREMRKRGYIRAYFWAPTLREAGIDVIVAPSYLISGFADKKRRLGYAPWAPARYVEMARRAQSKTATAHEKAAWEAIREQARVNRANKSSLSVTQETHS